MSNVADYFYKGGLNCAETVMRCLIENKVIDVPEDTVRMMTGFGGGMRRGSVCGAVIGAVSAIGAKKGRLTAEDAKAPAQDAVKQFLERFEEKFGTIYCSDLQKKYVKEHKLKSKGMYRACTVFVEEAYALAKELIETETPEEKN